MECPSGYCEDSVTQGFNIVDQESILSCCLLDQGYYLC
uniref:Uncharacterized protein n=1 Tax=Vitis vinifera TaxID=29760 RepID=F6HJY2_VITVI